LATENNLCNDTLSIFVAEKFQQAFITALAWCPDIY